MSLSAWGPSLSALGSLTRRLSAKHASNAKLEEAR